MVTAAKCLAKYGEPNIEFERKWMTLYVIPAHIRKAIPALPARIYLNKDLLGPLSNAFELIAERGLGEHIETWDGCFSVRRKRGLRSWSLHSWAIAIDVNAVTNGLYQPSTQNPELVKCFLESGMVWGGTWKSRSDPMHFELAKI